MCLFRWINSIISISAHRKWPEMVVSPSTNQVWTKITIRSYAHVFCHSVKKFGFKKVQLNVILMTPQYSYLLPKRQEFDVYQYGLNNCLKSSVTTYEWIQTITIDRNLYDLSVLLSYFLPSSLRCTNQGYLLTGIANCTVFRMVWNLRHGNSDPPTNQGAYYGIFL